MLPEQFTDRRQGRPGAPDFADSVCWHLLLGDQEQVQTMAREARQRLDGFTGLHMTPLRWLHATVLLVGRAADLTQDDMDQMLAKARLKLNGTVPPTVALGRVIYHPEGILLSMSPATALNPIFEAAQAATLEVTGNPGVTSTPGPSWVPHVTLCYSTSQQPAGPIIAALGKALPFREVTIDKLTLVIQHGPALSWEWLPIGTAYLGQYDDLGSSLPLN
jgi:2'-5' RNA ligase